MKSELIVCSSVANVDYQLHEHLGKKLLALCSQINEKVCHILYQKKQNNSAAVAVNGKKGKLQLGLPALKKLLLLDYPLYSLNLQFFVVLSQKDVQNGSTYVI